MTGLVDHATILPTHPKCTRFASILTPHRPPEFSNATHLPGFAQRVPDGRPAASPIDLFHVYFSALSDQLFILVRGQMPHYAGLRGGCFQSFAGYPLRLQLAAMSSTTNYGSILMRTLIAIRSAILVAAAFSGHVSAQAAELDTYATTSQSSTGGRRTSRGELRLGPAC